MQKDKGPSDPASGLRERAKEIFEKKSENNQEVSPLSGEETSRLISELQIHQIELEIQNEELRRTQLELEATRDRYTELYDFAPIGYVTLEVSGIIKEANLAGAALLGMERRALLGMRFSAFITRDSQDVFYFHRQKLIETKAPQKCELKLVKKDGAEFYALVETIPVQDGGGNCTEFRTAVSDISGRKQEEEEVQVREKELIIRNRIADVFLRIPDNEMFGAILEVVLEAMESRYGVFGYIDEDGNQVCPSMTRDIWEQCRVPDKDIIFPREKWYGIWGQALKEKRPIKSNGPFRVPQGHIPIQRAFAMPIVYQDEVIGMLHVANKATNYDEKDEKLFVEIAKNVAPVLYARLEKDRQEKKRKRAEEAVGKSEERLRLLAETMDEGLIIQDKQSLISFVNERLCRLLGYTRDECIGRSLAAFLEEKHRGLQDALAGRKGGDRIFLEADLRRKDGQMIRTSIAAQPLIAADGQLRGSFALFTDITELSALRRRVEIEEGFEGMVGHDPLMLELFDAIRRVAAYDYPVLIQGESGTGKELVAMAIHNVSPRSGKRFVPVNCGALPEGLLESEIFGHVKGSFTGAIRDKKGRFELAEGGTIFFDEIGELSPAMQVKLLRILQEGTYEQVGGEQTKKANARIISATNKDLQKEVKAGKFREDLFYRLCVIPINTPTLRERPGDIPLLAEHILKQHTKKSGKEEVALSPESRALLAGYAWPGNVRELQNTIQFALLKSQGKTIEPLHLPGNISPMPKRKDAKQPTRRKIDGQAIAEALRKANGNKLVAAKILGIGRATLYRALADEQQTQ